MNTAALTCYNLDRLIRASGRSPLDVALSAWPLRKRLTPEVRYRETDNRRRRMGRYLAGTSRPRGDDLDRLAAALGVSVAEFYREPSN